MRRFTPYQHAVFIEVARAKGQQLEILVTSRDWNLRRSWVGKGQSPKDLNAAYALVKHGWLELLKNDVYEQKYCLRDGEPDKRTEARFGISPKGLEYLENIEKFGNARRMRR